MHFTTLPRHLLTLLWLLLIALAPSLLLEAAPQQAEAEARQQPASAADQPLPFDPTVRRGTLPNGLTYYIRHNERPEDRVLLRLAVKAGSVDEEDDQLGLAHFLEHMAFNGSEHYDPGALMATFESAGARLGPHVNAYTSFVETVYMLQLPVDGEGLVRQGLVALADFAGRLTLDPEEIDRERGVVIEEWRGGLGAQARVRDNQMPVLFHGSRYAERLPIGDPEILKTFEPARLRAFYEKWYRPDRMAIIVVGDLDAVEIEGTIGQVFGELQARPSEPPPRAYPVPLHEDALLSVTTDPELTQASVSIVWKRPNEADVTVQDYRRLLVRHLVTQMINERLDTLARSRDAQFLRAGASGGALSEDVAIFSLAAGVQEENVAEGLSAIALEAKRAREHGFVAAELERAKTRTVARYERAFAERDTTESGSFAREYVSHFLEGEPAPGISFEYTLVQELLPTIDVDQVNEAVRELLKPDSRVVLAAAPEKLDLAVPDSTRLSEVLASVESTEVVPWAEAPSSRPLMTERPAPGVMVGRRELADLGVTIVSFTNGVEAWLKPTDFKTDQVLFTLYARGGSSVAPPEHYFEASLATSLIERSGVGGHSAEELERLLAGTLAQATPFISTSTHGIQGAAPPAQLETGLQLLFQAFTAPGNDEDAFAVLQRQLQAAVMNKDQNPSVAFRERAQQINTSHHYTSRPLTAADVESLDRSIMATFYQEAFTNASRFTFFMVGAFDIGKVLPLVARYVGSLPSTGVAETTYEDLAVRFPEEVTTEIVEKGREPRSRVVISFFADPPPDEMEQSRLSAAADVLQMTLRDLMRETLGQTYRVSVNRSQPLPQRGAGRVIVSFSAAPDNVEALVDRVLEEVGRLREEGPSADLTNRVKESARRENETALQQNRYWLARLQTAHLLGRDPGLILTRPARIDALTPELLQRTFQDYFPLDRYTVVSLMPEQQ